MKKRILYNPLTDEFTTLGDKFEKIAHNKVNGMYCYKRKGEKKHRRIYAAYAQPKIVTIL